MKNGTLFLPAVILVLLTVTLAGCWNRRELNTLAIVAAVGIDRAPENGKISVTVQIVKPGELKAISTGRGGSPKAVSVITSTGDTVFDAIRNAVIKVDRKLFWPHNKIIIIGEEMARAGITPLLDFFEREPESRRLTWLLVAKGGKAADILEAEGELEKIPAASLESMIKARGATSVSVGVRLHDFLKMLTADGQDSFASRIELIGGDEQGQAGTGGGVEGGNKRDRLTGAAVFREDRLAGWLDHTETRGLLWVLGKVQSGIIVVPSPRAEKEKVGLEIIRASSKIKPEITGGRLAITVEIEEEGNLGDQMSLVDLTKPETWDSLEKRQAEVIENEVRAALRKAQAELGVDIFGFGQAVHRKYPREWEELKGQWRDVYPWVEVEVKVTAKLRRMGLDTKPNVPK